MKQYHNKRLRAGPYVYRIDQSEGNAAALGGDDGMITHDQEKIYIAPSLSRRRALQTIWHEHIHAMLEAQGFQRHNERLVDGLATQLVAMLQEKQNRWLVTATMESGHDD